MIDDLTALECIRLRPGMYVGDVDETGLYRLALRLLRDLLESTPPPTRVHVSIDQDALTITDDRHLLPPDAMRMRTLAEQMSEHGGGLVACFATTVANALSREFTFEMWSGGVGLRSVYERGELRAGPMPFTPTSEHGVRVRFAADETIIPKTAWNYPWLADRLQVLAALYGGVHVEVRDLAQARGCECLFPRGPASWIERLAPSSVPREALRATAVQGELRCDIGWTWVTTGPRVLGYCNTVHTREGGPHTAGFRAAIGRLGRARGLYPFALVSVFLPDPDYEIPERNRLRLATPEIGPLVRETVAAALEQALTNPQLRAALT